MEFREAVLDNGLEIVAEVNPQAYSLGLAFFVKTGARDETDEISGVSHFLEHMVFKGTPRRSSLDVNREFDEIGSKSNAFTSEEQTVYYTTVLPEYQERALDLLADILRPSLREEDFQTEKQVIIEEISMYDDTPPFRANEICAAAHFGKHPLGRSILGSIESIAAMTSADMRRYFEQRYSPKNIALVAAGNVDFDGLVAAAKARCGAWRPFDPLRLANRAPKHTGFSVVHKESAAQQYAVQIANGPAAEDEDRYASRLLATIFGDESGSRLFWALVDKGLAEYAATGVQEYQGSGLYMTYLASDPSEAQANLSRLCDLQRQLEQGGITEAELQQAKNKISSHIVLASERPTSRLFSVGDHWIQRRSYRSVKEVIGSYQSVTRRDVQAVLQKYPLSESTTVCIGPLRELSPPK